MTMNLDAIEKQIEAARKYRNPVILPPEQARELVRLARIGDAVELHYECEGLADDAVASICNLYAKQEPTA